MGVEDDQKLETWAHRDQQAELEREEALIFIQQAITDLGTTGGFDVEPTQLISLLNELTSDTRIRSIYEIRSDAAGIVARRNLDH